MNLILRPLLLKRHPRIDQNNHPTCCASQDFFVRSCLGASWTRAELLSVSDEESSLYKTSWNKKRRRWKKRCEDRCKRRFKAVEASLDINPLRATNRQCVGEKNRKILSYGSTASVQFLKCTMLHLPAKSATKQSHMTTDGSQVYCSLSSARHL